MHSAASSSYHHCPTSSERRYSDPSDEEALNEAQAEAASRKRSSRACDQCRKTKSKCERGLNDNAPCKSCAVADLECTFLGPGYKRGPPKGYIHAIEQRWHHVESILGAILASPDPRAQGLISDLRRDDLAREILNRVDAGPFGPSGRLHHPAFSTKEDMFASILHSHQASQNREGGRSQRQSHINALPTPTNEWQDRLAARLATSSSFSRNSYGYQRDLVQRGHVRSKWCPATAAAIRLGEYPARLE
ncbi:hypothetical protein PUNSTDRAFT_131800 [Punctularia strigosozonata HHB-11173 SS5]|uniref:uncharacterized protein n=1 Tax=Punctularia strigosozonata (strain HHB-11173) TaxID=741275 RepID=UPI00044179AC|nr:uncharacterized protein PUNSTDRAFT_131800 [Punctularia strigosozonata HHB-11173 SS5]EIN11641.1 hypothetical protein PUNSTDRAFT_131800 [Punctularia strigosozonata HHB-11173 SS5]